MNPLSKETSAGNPAKSALTDSGLAVGASLLLGAVLVLMPALAFLTVPLIPIPVAFVTSRYGLLTGVTAGLVTSALAVVIAGPVAGLLVGLLVAAAGVGAGICLRLGFSQMRLFVCVALIFFASLLLWMTVLLAMAGKGPVTAVSDLTETATTEARDFYIVVGMSPEDVDAAMERAREFSALLPYLAPAILLVTSVLFSGTCLAVARRIFARRSQPFPRDFVFRELRLHFAFAYVMILGLACELVAPWLPEQYGGVVDVVGANLLIASEVAFFIQGLAIANWFLWRHQLSRGKKTGIYSGLVLLQIMLSLTSWLGLFDTWVDYRKRFGGKKKQ